MKFTTSIFTFLLSTLVASEGLSFGSSFSLGGQKALGDGAPVPGDNPLTYCKKDHDDDILALDLVNLSPNPPLKYNVPRPLSSYRLTGAQGERSSLSKRLARYSKMSMREHMLSCRSNTG